MKYIEPENWKYTSDLEGLLYFAQVLNEALFDYSFDTYKPNALNGHSITHEALQITQKVKSKHIPEGNLKPIQEELSLLFSKDIAIKAILGNKLEFYCSKIKACNNPDDLFHTVFSVHSYLDDKRYLDKVKELLSSYVAEGKRKRDIFFLTRVLVTELMNYGYSKAYLYNLTNNFFFGKDSVIESPSQIDNFLSQFSFEEGKFSVLFQVSGNFWEFRNSLKNVDFKLTKTLRDKDKNVILRRFDDDRPKDSIYIIAHDVKALDHTVAGQMVESRLNLFINLFHVFHHRESLTIYDKVCVDRAKDHYTILVDRSVNSLLKQRDLPANEAAQRVDDMLSNMSFSKRNSSMNRFMKALELHKLALKSSEEENQLLDLWAALETLIQNKPESNKSRIEQISQGLIPFLSHKYITSLVIELFKDLRNWNSEEFDKILESIDADTSKRFESFLKVLSINKFTNKREELIGLLDKYPLLKNRIFLYNKWFSDSSEMSAMITRHAKKIHWQIRRIYRARNMIIHHGGKPEHLNILIENLGSYIHSLIKGLASLMQSIKIRSIEHGVIEMDIIYNDHLKLLEKTGEVTEDNLLQIFGLEE